MSIPDLTSFESTHVGKPRHRRAGPGCGLQTLAIQDGQKWLLWYNGRIGGVEQIELATHEGEDLGF